MNAIGVFSGSTFGADDTYRIAADKLGAELAERKIRLVCGGGNEGLMRTLVDSVVDRGGEAVGVIPSESKGMEIPNSRLTRLVTVATISERKSTILDLADGCVALPGGLGTLDELFQAYSLAKLGLYNKPVGLLNVNGFFDPLLLLLNDMVEKGFMKPKHFAILSVHNEPTNLLEKLLIHS